jgi:glucokinase
VIAGELVGALDIGGTHVSAGRVDLSSGSVEPGSRHRLPLVSDGTRAELLASIVRAARSVAGRDDRRLGVAVPGPFDYDAGVSRIAHKLDALYGVDLRSELADALHLPDPAAVTFVNDAEAFVLGEWWAGAAYGHARVVGVTLGTGLGSAFLEDGRIVVSGRGVPAAGELYRLSFRGVPVEDTISSRGLLARYTGESDDVEAVATLARAGDGNARRAFEDLAQALGEFLAPWLRGFEPSCLVVGGSIARSWELLVGPLRGELEPIASLDTVAVSQKLDDASLLGAAWYAASLGR